jgi:hypothetical protein
MRLFVDSGTGFLLLHIIVTVHRDNELACQECCEEVCRPDAGESENRANRLQISSLRSVMATGKHCRRHELWSADSSKITHMSAPCLQRIVARGFGNDLEYANYAEDITKCDQTEIPF